MWLLRRSQLVREESMQRLARPCYTVANPSEVAKPAGMPKSLIVTWSAVGTRPFRASRSAHERRECALLTGEDHLRGGWRSGGRRETDLDALITHQLHTSSPMDSAAGVARSRSGAGPTGSGCSSTLTWRGLRVSWPSY